MFIYDTLRIGMKYDYFLQPKQMKEIFNELSSLDNEAIVVVQSDLHSLHNNYWINLSQKFNKPVFFSYITDCYDTTTSSVTSLLEPKKTFLFVAKNQNDYKILKRVKCYFDNQYLSHVDAHAITFLERIGISVFRIDYEKQRMIHLNSKETLNLTPFTPIKKVDFCIHEHLYNSARIKFDSVIQNINTPFNQWIKKLVHLANWEDNESNYSQPFKQKILGLINWNLISEKEKDYIHKEINWLDGQNLTPLLYLAALLFKSDNSIRFEKSFCLFRTSYALGIIQKEDIKKVELSNIPNDYFEHFDMNISITGELSLLNLCQTIMEKEDYSVKLPVHNKEVSLKTIFQMHPQMQDNIDNIAFLNELIDMKKDYDSRGVSEKKSFIQDMKLYFLFKPELKEIFHHSIQLTKEEILEHSVRFSNFAIFPKNSEVSKLDVLLLDYQVALRKRIPILNIKNRGFKI